MNHIQNPFRLNIGYFHNQPVGYSRDFLFEIDQTSLAPDISVQDLLGVVRITRTAQGLLVQVKMDASLDATCTRCLAQIKQGLKVNFTELYAVSRQSAVDTEMIVPESGYLDLRPLLREYFLLEVPINTLCQPDCKGLCPICGKNLNQFECDHQIEDIDPRLAKLGTLLKD